MWVVDVESLRFLAVNEAALRQYGYTRDEFMRLTLRDIRPPSELARVRVGDWDDCPATTSVRASIAARTGRRLTSKCGATTSISMAAAPVWSWSST